MVKKSEIKTKGKAKDDNTIFIVDPLQSNMNERSKSNLVF